MTRRHLACLIAARRDSQVASTARFYICISGLSVLGFEARLVCGGLADLFQVFERPSFLVCFPSGLEVLEARDIGGWHQVDDVKTVVPLGARLTLER